MPLGVYHGRKEAEGRHAKRLMESETNEAGEKVKARVACHGRDGNFRAWC